MPTNSPRYFTFFKYPVNVRIIVPHPPVVIQTAPHKAAFPMIGINRQPLWFPTWNTSLRQSWNWWNGHLSIMISTYTPDKVPDINKSSYKRKVILSFLWSLDSSDDPDVTKQKTIIHLSLLDLYQNNVSMTKALKTFVRPLLCEAATGWNERDLFIWYNFGRLKN